MEKNSSVKPSVKIITTTKSESTLTEKEIVKTISKDFNEPKKMVMVESQTVQTVRSSLENLEKSLGESTDKTHLNALKGHLSQFNEELQAVIKKDFNSEVSGNEMQLFVMNAPIRIALIQTSLEKLSNLLTSGNGMNEDATQKLALLTDNIKVLSQQVEPAKKPESVQRVDNGGLINVTGANCFFNSGMQLLVGLPNLDVRLPQVKAENQNKLTELNQILALINEADGNTKIDELDNGPALLIRLAALQAGTPINGQTTVAYLRTTLKQEFEHNIRKADLLAEFKTRLGNGQIDEPYMRGVFLECQQLGIPIDNYGAQQDVAEFVQPFLDMLGYKTELRKDCVSVANPNVTSSTVVREPLITMSIPHDQQSIQDCITGFTQQERGDGTMRFGNELFRREFNQQFSITQLPTVLHLHVKRYQFENNVWGVNRGRVVPQTPLTITDGNGQQKTYDLNSISCHRNNGVGGGHYVTYRWENYGGQHQWVCYNDNVVTTHGAQLPEEVQRGGAMFQYVEVTNLANPNRPPAIAYQPIANPGPAFIPNYFNPFLGEKFTPEVTVPTFGSNDSGSKLPSEAIDKVKQAVETFIETAKDGHKDDIRILLHFKEPATEKDKLVFFILAKTVMVTADDPKNLLKLRERLTLMSEKALEKLATGMHEKEKPAEQLAVLSGTMVRVDQTMASGGSVDLTSDNDYTCLFKRPSGTVLEPRNMPEPDSVEKTTKSAKKEGVEESHQNMVHGLIGQPSQKELRNKYLALMLKAGTEEPVLPGKTPNMMREQSGVLHGFKDFKERDVLTLSGKIEKQLVYVMPEETKINVLRALQKADWNWFKAIEMYKTDNPQMLWDIRQFEKELTRELQTAIGKDFANISQSDMVAILNENVRTIFGKEAGLLFDTNYYTAHVALEAGLTIALPEQREQWLDTNRVMARTKVAQHYLATYGPDKGKELFMATAPSSKTEEALYETAWQNALERHDHIHHRAKESYRQARRELLSLAEKERTPRVQQRINLLCSKLGINDPKNFTRHTPIPRFERLSHYAKEALEMEAMNLLYSEALVPAQEKFEIYEAAKRQLDQCDKEIRTLFNQASDKDSGFNVLEAGKVLTLYLRSGAEEYKAQLENILSRAYLAAGQEDISAAKVEELSQFIIHSDRAANEAITAQSHALFYANEPYYSHSSIIAIAADQQNLAKLDGNTQKERVFPLLKAPQVYAESCVENYGDFVKDFRHYTQDLHDAQKFFYRGAKYLFRIVWTAEKYLEKLPEDKKQEKQALRDKIADLDVLAKGLYELRKSTGGDAERKSKASIILRENPQLLRRLTSHNRLQSEHEDFLKDLGRQSLIRKQSLNPQSSIPRESSIPRHTRQSTITLPRMSSGISYSAQGEDLLEAASELVKAMQDDVASLTPEQSLSKLFTDEDFNALLKERELYIDQKMVALEKKMETESEFIGRVFDLMAADESNQMTMNDAITAVQKEMQLGSDHLAEVTARLTNIVAEEYELDLTGAVFDFLASDRMDSVIEKPVLREDPVQKTLGDFETLQKHWKAIDLISPAFLNLVQQLTPEELSGIVKAIDNTDDLATSKRLLVEVLRAVDKQLTEESGKLQA